MAVVRTPSGHPTLSEVAVALSDPRVGLGEVTRQDVFRAACNGRVIVRESRIESKAVSTIYFALHAERSAAPPSRFNYDPRDPRNPLSLGL